MSGPNRRPTITPGDVSVRDLPRRSFMRVLGMSVPAWTLAVTGAGCVISDPVRPSDADTTVTVTDADPSDVPNRIVRVGDEPAVNDSD